MLNLRILGSGSAGNAALLTTDRCRVLIDAGFSARQLVTRLALCGCAPEELDAIIITHEHGDHTRGLEVLTRKLIALGREIPVFTNAFTAADLKASMNLAHVPFKLFETGRSFDFKDLHINTFAIPHDAVDPVGLVFEHADGSLGYLTDLGHATKSVIERVRGVHTLVLETNYDRELLINDTKRPWPVMQRIRNRHGHLSNDAACEVLAQLHPFQALQRVITGHLSGDCNTPERVLVALRKQLTKLGCGHIEVFCALQEEVSPHFEIVTRRVDVVQRPEMLSLFDWAGLGELSASAS
jgi:phosphoribosyl 1,2-cyclic phosphodiesterase